MEKIIEYCPFCEDEKEINVNGGKCKECGRFLKPCSLCNNDIVDCNKCENDKTLQYMKVANKFDYVMETDCAENNGGYFVKIYYKDYSEDECYDTMVIHFDNKAEMENPTKYIKEYVNNLIEEIIKKNK